MYVLLHTWDHEDGSGSEVITVSGNKSHLRSLMRDNAQVFKDTLRDLEETDDSMWDTDLTEYNDDSITLGYETYLPNTWRWEIQQIDDSDPVKVAVVVDGGRVCSVYSDHPEQISLEVIDLDDAVAKDNPASSEAIYHAAAYASKTLERIY